MTGETTYLFCALFTLSLIGFKYFEDLAKLPLSAQIFLVLTNATIFFQDITMFLGVNDGTLSFVKSFSESSPPLHQLLLIPQGWSLGSELSFYMLTPFILCRSVKFLGAAIILSLLLRIFLVLNSCSGDPWSYRFFPTELATFLLGALAFRMHRRSESVQTNLYIAYLKYGALLFFMAIFFRIPLDYRVLQSCFVIALAFFIGDVFDLTKNSKFDNFVGMLSYPVYICHILIIVYLLPRFGFNIRDGSAIDTAIIYTAVIAFSLVLYFFIEKPVDNFRHRFKTCGSS